MKKCIIIVTLVAVFAFSLTACSGNDIPRKEYGSLEKIDENLPSEILIPAFVSELSADEYDVHYYIESIPNPSGTSFSKPIKTGYSIELHCSGLRETHYDYLEIRGVDMQYSAYMWERFPSMNYTCVRSNVDVNVESLDFSFSEYRPYPYNDSEIAEQKNTSSDTASNNVSTETFSVFDARIQFDNYQYTLTFYGVSANMSEETLIQLSNEYFRNILGK